MPAPPLTLRPLHPGDEAEARLAHRELAAEDFPFLLDLRDDEPWARHLERHERLRVGVDLPAGFVPATFLVAVVGDRIVGRASIRHELNETLAETGGHIGYGVRPADRRRGHAGTILRQSLLLAREVGIENALLVCDVDNVASRRTIERAGGRFERLTRDGPCGAPMQRFWVPT